MKKFTFKPFEEMTPEDYSYIGFKSGLEVHQQLLTEKKLFCRDKAGVYSDKYNAEILRHMRPTLSEMGEYDGTALMEFKTKKEITYRINYDTVCTYEMDDTPPFEINDEALDIALEVGMLYNSSIVDELHIARKQYLDGSIPTGFQRTAITCVGGSVPYKDRRINMIQMSIEEDSCREVSDFGHKRVYLTDRLGTPLIESVTYPEMKTPQEVAEVCDILREVVRSTGRVRTGIGAGREDVNVSVEGGTRIEIKGVPSIKKIPILTYNEAMRQWRLLELREELHKRGITEETFEAEQYDVTKLFNKTHYEPIKNALKEGHFVKAVVLKGFAGLLSWKTQTDTVFSKEISDRVRVIACLTRLPNIIHSDARSENLVSHEWKKLISHVNSDYEDTIVLVWGDKQDSECGAGEIIIRAKEATQGVPSETRQALWDGTTGFERILPGPERMYPDTDLPPKEITEERLLRIKSRMPEPIWEREKWYNEIGVPKDLIRDLKISKFANLFKKAVIEYNLEPKLVAKILIKYPKSLQKEGKNTSKLSEGIFDEIFQKYKAKEIKKESIYYTMQNFLKSKSIEIEEFFIKPIDEFELIERFRIAVAQFKRINIMNFNAQSVERLLMGIVMYDLRGKVDGDEVQKIIKKYVDEEVFNAE